MSGCGISIKYSDREDFKKEKEQERKELYKDVLSSIGIMTDTVSKYCLVYVDYIMTESDRYKTLERINPTDDFSKFFLESIPILYYSYSPTNYASVPKEYRAQTDRFLVEQTPYLLNYGEEKYRKWFKKGLQEKSPFLFVHFDKDKPEEAAKGLSHTEHMIRVMTMFAWEENCNYSDFKKLDDKSQALLIQTVAEWNWVNNGRSVDDEAQKVFKRVYELWENNVEDIKKTPSMKALKDDSPFTEVSEAAITVVKANL